MSTQTVKSKAFISRDNINKKLFSKFFPTPGQVEGEAKKKLLKEFVSLFKKIYKRAPSGLEIINITGTARKTFAKYLDQGKDYLTASESAKLSYTDPALKESKLKTRLDKPVDKLSFVQVGPRKGPFKKIPKFVDANQKKEYVKLLKEKYSVPRGTSNITTEFLAKKFGVSEDVIDAVNQAIIKEEKLKYPKQTYEGELLKKKEQAERRRKLIKKVSDPAKEKRIKDLKKGTELDLAHRSSLSQNKNLGLKYLISDLGFDPSKINQEIIVPTEQKLESLYKKQKFLYTKGKKFHLDKGKKIPPTLSKAIEDINKQITDVAYSTNGRLNGIVIDEKTLKPGKVGIDYSKIPGFGLLEDKPVKDLTKADFDLIKLNAGSQIDNEIQVAKTLTKLYESGTPELKKSFDKRIGCKTGCFVKKLNEEPEKIIRLFRGEPIFKPKDLGFTGDKVIPQLTRGRFFSKSPNVAEIFADFPGVIKKVNVTPEEFAKGKKIQTKTKIGSYVDPNEIILPKSKMADVGVDITKTLAYNLKNLKWDNIVGAFTTKDGDIASQADIKTYAADNPMEVKVGEEPVKVATNKSVLKNVGKAIATVGAPLPTALLDAYFINEQVKEGKGTAEIASNPLNWLGLATMEPLSKVAGVAETGKLNSLLRLGLNPATIRGISRFAGLPGLAISTALTAYDQYQKYKDGEGLIYNLFNKEGN